MNTDFRLSVGIFEHPKVQKLERRLGAGGVLAFIKLLRFTAQYKADGDLTGMDAEDIALAGTFAGEPSDFFDALVSLRLLDVDGETILVHDWHEHNPYAAHADARTEKAKKAAAARWGGAGSATTGTGNAPQKSSSTPVSLSKDVSCSEHNQALPQALPSNAPSPIPAPAPAPAPAPEPEREDEDAIASSAAAPPRGVRPKSLSAERREQIGQSACAAYQERYKARYGDFAQFIQGDSGALKDAACNLRGRFIPALDAFFASEDVFVLRKRHGVKSFTGDINTWLNPDSPASPARASPARASPARRDGIPADTSLSGRIQQTSDDLEGLPDLPAEGKVRR